MGCYLPIERRFTVLYDICVPPAFKEGISIRERLFGKHHQYRERFWNYQGKSKSFGL